MKTRAAIISKATVLVLLAALTLVLSISVTANTGNTTLTTSVPASFALTLEIQGNGTVTINAETYTESNVLQIPCNTDVTLQIVPEQGSNIKSVLYNGSDITGALIDGVVMLPTMSGDSKLNITFGAGHNTPQTGDHAFRSLVMAGIIMMLSLLCLVAVWRAKKKLDL